MTQLKTHRDGSQQRSQSHRVASSDSANQQTVRVDAGDSKQPGERDLQAGWTLLISRICRAVDSAEACRVLAVDLQRRLGAARVAVGIRSRPGAPCRLRALSDVEQFSRRSDNTRLIENAMEESLGAWENEESYDEAKFVWTRTADEGGSFTHSQRRLSLAGGYAVLQTLPLNNDDDVCGCLLIASSGTDFERETVNHFRSFAMLGVISALDAIRRASMTPGVRLVTSLRKLVHGRGFATALIVAAVLAAVLAIPRQYKVSADCLVQPATRRFVPLPFDAVLAESFAKPGDVVEAGDRLASLDGREIRCELTAVNAEADRVSKQRDMALAQGKVTEEQMARLELARLEQQRLVLERHASQLEIRSPISGIVISGDLDKVQGASLDKGRTLFEVGPLEKMTVEVMIPESEISLARVGAEVTLRLDSTPGRTWTGTIEKIHPRAELHEETNVFVAEVELENALAELRPGMQGRANIDGPKRSVGWALFHKPWRSLQRWFRT